MIWRLSHEVRWLVFKSRFLEILVIFSTILMLLRNWIIGSVRMLTHRKSLWRIFPEPIWIMRVWKILRPHGLTKIMISQIVKTPHCVIKRTNPPLISRIMTRVNSHIMFITKRLRHRLNVIMLKLTDLSRYMPRLLHPQMHLFITLPVVVWLRRRGIEPAVTPDRIEPHHCCRRIHRPLIALIRLSTIASSLNIVLIIIHVPYRSVTATIILLLLWMFGWVIDSYVGLVEWVLVGGPVGFIRLHLLEKLLHILSLVLE